MELDEPIGWHDLQQFGQICWRDRRCRCLRAASHNGLTGGDWVGDRGIAIRVGNIYLRRQRSNVEVLMDDEWLRWELAVESATSHEIVFQTHPSPYEKFRGLVSRVCSGRPLQNILIDCASSLDEQFAAIRWAMAALDPGQWETSCFH